MGEVKVNSSNASQESEYEENTTEGCCQCNDIRPPPECDIDEGESAVTESPPVEEGNFEETGVKIGGVGGPILKGENNKTGRKCNLL